MKTHLLPLLLAVPGLLLVQPAPVHGAAAAADSVHVCAIYDYEQWRRDHPRPAAKRLADLDVGEPRTVRMIYFLPNDRPFRQEVVDSIKVRIREVQSFFVDQMEAHGHGKLTLRIETDARGEPLVHRVDGQHPDSHYLDDTHVVYGEIEEIFDLQENIYLVVVDHSSGTIGLGGGRVAGGTGSGYKKRGSALVPNSVEFEVVAHELGHAFGLLHDFRDGAYIMSYGPGRLRLSACNAEFLEVHPYFDPESSLESDKERLPAVELTSSPAYPADAGSVPIHLRVTDSEGLHQVILFAVTRDIGITAGGSEVKACRGLSGERETVVEFEYDGSIPSSFVSTLSDPIAHPIRVQVINSEGDVGRTELVLAEISPHLVATLDAHGGEVNSVAFSPDGKTLASSGSWDAEAKLWSVSARRSFATLRHADAVSSLAFSSTDRAILASGSRDRTIKLWDGKSGRQIAALEGHTDGVTSVAFSAGGGSLLASGSRDGTIKLWDVGARAGLGTLEAHTSEVTSVSVSPDGTILASAARRDDDEAVKLWDLGTRERIGSLEGHTYGATSVSFSPDGATLASGSGNGSIILWDVATREEIATLEDHSSRVDAVSFSSPDGSILASSSWDGRVTLWDLLTREKVASFGHTKQVLSVSLSPGGATLAAGGRDGKVLLWDVSEWMGPRPFALDVVSGDGQQGAPGGALPQPLAVEVRDQYGNLLPDAAVTFTVTVGEGKLSGRYSVEHTTTGTDGRAELTLSLGPNPGQNIVGVSLGGRELATFHAEGVGTAVAELVGDYRTWHLPQAATVRLGKGALGNGDRAVALSADGRCLAVASGIGVWLYEAATSRAQALLPTERAVHSVSFSLDGTLAAGLDNGQVELWEVETGEQIGTLRHGGWGGLTVAFSPDGTRLASRWRQVIKLWDVATRRLDGTWDVPTDIRWHGAGQSVAFSPDGSTLVSGFQDGTVRLWDVADQTEVVTLDGRTDWVISVSFSPDGSLLASAGGREDPTVRLWDVATQKEIATLKGHTREVNSVAFSSPDGAVLASGSSDGTVRLWDVAAQQEVATLDEHGDGIRSVAFSRDGATLVSAAADGTVLLRDVETGNASGLSGHGSLSSMALSPDGSLLASGHEDGAVRLWDAVTRTAIATLEGHPSRVGSVSFSSDGALLATGSYRTVKLWDVGTRTLVGTLEGHRGEVTSVAFSPDGATLASAGGWNDATVRLWDVATREAAGILEGHTKAVESVAFSPDGATLASGGGHEDKTVKLWDVATRELMGTLEGHRYEVNTVAFSPDGKTLASGSGDREVRLWDVATRSPIGTLQDRNTVRSVAFSPDGKSLVSGSSGTVTLWEVGTRTRTATLTGHRGSVHSLAFSRDGATLTSGASDGTMLLWNLGPHPRTLSRGPERTQRAPAGTALPLPFVVRVRDQYGDLLPGATVTFAVTAGGGTLSVTTVTTDADGRAATTLTLGRQPGTNTVEATVDRLEPVIFTAVGVAMAQTLNKPSGDGQEGEAGAALGEPFVVEVRDQNGNPLPGARVTFAVTAGGGGLSATTATTDADGRASATLTLGRTPGRNTVRAAVTGVEPVIFTATGLAVPRTLAKLSGDEQQAAAGGQVAEPLVVSVRDQNGAALPGVVVTFSIPGDGGTLSAAADTTDAEGLAATTLTLGEQLGTYRVEVTVTGLQPVTFTAAAKATPDFDGDGVTDFSDFFLFAEAFGGTDPRFDLDGSGTVDFADFFLFAESFGQPARARLLALARERIGLPDGPQLQQNAPNPFNSGTVITWFQLQAGPARLEVFALTGQRVAVLHEGLQKAGLHRSRWDARGGHGRPLASGVYVYRLVTTEAMQTRKLTLLR